MKRLALLLALGLAACQPTQKPVLAPVAAGSEELRQETIRVAGANAEFVVRLPAAKGRRPLILALHYGGKPTPWYGEGLIERLVGPAFRELDAVIVAPTCLDGSWASVRCEAIAIGVLEHALASYPVDPERVLVTGFSMGGMGTWHLASKYPDRFSAALPVAGRPPAGPLPSIPVWALHSTDDELISIGPSQAVFPALTARDPRSHLEVIEGVTHYQTSGFADPLARAVPWIRSIWGDAPGS
jgi:poly(3-hydroxybutyrate) depolymerase